MSRPSWERPKATSGVWTITTSMGDTANLPEEDAQLVETCSRAIIILNYHPFYSVVCIHHSLLYRIDSGVLCLPGIHHKFYFISAPTRPQWGHPVPSSKRTTPTLKQTEQPTMEDREPKSNREDETFYDPQDVPDTGNVQTALQDKSMGTSIQTCLSTRNQSTQKLSTPQLVTEKT